MSVDLFIDSSYSVSELITHKYSTSFALATSFLEKEKKKAIYAVYGFVRLADEIVDSLHGFDKSVLLQKLNKELTYAMQNGISTNIILVSFADTVKRYDISKDHIWAFMKSMENDLSKTYYSNFTELNDYIYGSANVVGLMCLKIFCNGQYSLYKNLELPAQRLGSAFQKVNFLRDLREDMDELGRNYFPEIEKTQFDEAAKRKIEESIQSDFNEARSGIKKLPGRSRLSVALAYYYYMALFNKIKHSSPEKVLQKRIRISNIKKYMILVKVYVLYKTKLI